MRKIGVIILIFAFSKATAQTDNVLWSSFQLQKSISKNTTVHLKPIFRFNDDISTYQNMSIDYFVKQKFANGWSTQLLGRTWFLPSSANRQFIWLDVALSKSIHKIKIDNRLRYHWALDINDRSDPDFFRWLTKISFKNSSNFTPYIGIEPWLRTNTQNKFQRIRYEPGVIWILNPDISINLQYRHEESINLSPKRITNFIVFNLLYKI